MTIFWIAGVILVTYVCWLPFYRNPLYQDQALNYFVGRWWIKGKIPAKDYAMGPGPVLYLFYALSGLVAKNNEVLFHFLSATYVAIGNVFLFLATDSVYGVEAAITASILFAFFIFSPRLIGDRFPPEVYMAPPCLAALYFLFQHMETSSWLSAFLCGFLIGLGTLIRQGAYLYVPVIFLAIAWGSTIVSATIYGIGFLGSHALWIAYFWYKGGLRQYLLTTLFRPIIVVLFGNWEGPGKGRIDPMRVSGDRMIGLIMSNSLTILPLYLLALSFFVYESVNGFHIQTLAVGCLFITGLSLILPRKNFDCCYWLNAVPWAAMLAGNCLAMLYAGFHQSLDIVQYTCVFLLLGYLGYIMGFDYRPYFALNPEERDRLLDPQKVGHGSWWPTFNKIGDYLAEESVDNAKILILGHAARIYNRSHREAFFYFPSFNLFRAKETEPGEYERFMSAITSDYPDIIVLAGHMPAFLFNKEPYLEDMARIQMHSGILYKKMKEIDGFPIYVAETDKSYLRAIVKGEFRNRRLEKEKTKIRKDILLFEKTKKSGKENAAILSFVHQLKSEKRSEDIIFLMGEVGDRDDLVFTDKEYETLFLALGEAQFDMGHEKDAENTFQQIVKKWPQSYEAINNLGVIYFSRGEYSKAREMFERVLRQDATNASAKNNLMFLNEGEQALLAETNKKNPITKSSLSFS